MSLSGQTRGEAFVARLPQKRAFYDDHERRAYLRAVEVAKRIIDQPDLLRSARAFMDAHMRDDPHQVAAHAAWFALLPRGAEAVAAALLEDSGAGEALRGSAPVFVVVTPEALQRAWRSAP